MKFGITKREKLAAVAFLNAKPTANQDERDTRLSAWDDLGVVELAAALNEAATMGQAAPDAKPWLDNAHPVLVDLQDGTLRFLLKGLSGEIPGAWSDILGLLQRRLLRLEAKTYELPKELRK
jgi:hypothetical protein